MCEWYYLIGEEHFGPVSTKEISSSIHKGKLDPNTFVYREGMTDWVEASKCEEFAAGRSNENNNFSRGQIFGYVLLAVVVIALLFLPSFTDYLTERRQGKDPIMRQNTLEAWKSLNAVNVAVSDYKQRNMALSQMYAQRLHLLSEIKLEQVDPKMTLIIQDSIRVSKEMYYLWIEVEDEIRQLQSFNQGTANFMETVGLLAGAFANNGRDAEQNVRLGQMAGNIAGRVSATVMTPVQQKAIETKYKPRIDELLWQSNQIDEQRKILASKFTEKYKTPFLEGL